MSEEQFHGVAVYNPGLLSREELKRYFVARQGLLQRLLDDLTREKPGHAPQHRLLLGLRGMGKTTLLHRLAIAIEEDETLSSYWLPLTFPEEQYNIADLTDLWLNCLDALGDKLERSGHSAEAEQLDQRISALARGNAEAALAVLLEQANQQGKRLLLLIDNIDLVLDRLKQQHWVLRETLQAESRLLLIGASSAAIEASYQYDAAFYDFFKIDELKGLSETDMRETLLRLAEIKQNPQIRELIERDNARIKTLHTLTGGNPRTTVLLYNVLAQGLENGDVRSDLDGLLDQVTPLYKARFEELSTQAQQMVDALAIHWDPMNANQLAEALGWEVNKVSAQLNRLQQLALVEKQPPAQGKRHLFQLGERFFNIWYLMRASRRVRRKLIWLVHFLRMFFGADELQQHAQQRLHGSVKDQGEAEYRLALAQAIDDQPLRNALEHQALGHLINDNQTRKAIYELLDLKGEDAVLLPTVTHLQALAEIREQVTNTLENCSEDFDTTRFCELLLGSAALTLEVKKQVAARSAQLSIKQWQGLTKNFEEEQSQWCHHFGDSAIIFSQSLISGEIKDTTDLAGAQSAATHYNRPELLAIAYTYSPKLTETISAEQVESAFVTALKQHQSSELWSKFGYFLGNRLQRYTEAAEAYHQAIKTLPENPDAEIKNTLDLIKEKFAEQAVLTQKIAELNVATLYEKCSLITLLTTAQRWPEAMPHFKCFIREASDEFTQTIWPDIVQMFREIIVIGKADEALTCLDETGAGERWRPLREALMVIVSGNERHLNSVAPEIRDPARIIVEQLRSDSTIEPEGDD